MKMIRMAVLVAAASAAATKAKEYARQNPDQASQTLDKVESFVAGKAGPKYTDKVGKGGAALRSSLGLPAGTSGGTSGGTSAGTSAGGSSSAGGAGQAPNSAPAAPTGFDPSI